MKRRTTARLAQARGGGELPLVSCMMPTADRADFVEQAMRYFRRQTYPNRELVIVDDGSDDLEARLPQRSWLLYLRLAERHSIGAKRNLACEHARGTIMAHWDDDDLYDDDRLTQQVVPLLRQQAEITALSAELFFELEKWRFWTCDEELRRRMFYRDIHGGTLVYERSLWTAGARYPDTSLAEDIDFLRQAMADGGRLQMVRNRGLVTYLRHARSTWQFPCGGGDDEAEQASWRRRPEPPLEAADRLFYAQRSTSRQARRPVPVGRSRRKPLVSCLMPTADRPRWARRALAYFKRQDYPRLELVIVDSGRHPLEFGAELDDPSIHYLRADPDLSLGELRNLACAAAEGELMVHWDDDDWQAPWRVRYQVSQLREAEICGLAALRFYDPWRRRSWRYESAALGTGVAWLAGGTLCYRRRLWRRGGFPHLADGEDTAFVARVAPHSCLALDDDRFYVALLHSENTSSRPQHDRAWQPWPVDRVERRLGRDLDFYRTLAASIPLQEPEP